MYDKGYRRKDFVENRPPVLPVFNFPRWMYGGMDL